MSLVCALSQIYMLVLLTRVVLSWFPISPSGPIATFAGFLYLITDPVLLPLRRLLPAVRLGSMAVDLSPIAAFFGITVLQSIVC